MPGERAFFLARLPDSTPSASGHPSRRPPAARPASPPPPDPVMCPASVRSPSPVARSHTCSVSSDAGDRPPPVRRHATAHTEPPCPASVRSPAPVARSHTFSVVIRPRDRPPPVRRHRHRIHQSTMPGERAHFRARLQVPHPQRLVLRAETARRPSGVTATALTRACARRASVRLRPVSRSHTLSVSSSNPETARRPSGVTATHPHRASARRASVRPAPSPGPTPSGSGPHTRKPPAARPASPPPHEPKRCARRACVLRAGFQIPDFKRIVIGV